MRLTKHLTLFLFIGLAFWGCEDNSQVDCAGVEDGENICGCMDSTANNYNAIATSDDGSCTYGFMDFEPQWFFEEYINGYLQIAIGKGYGPGLSNDNFKSITLTNDFSNYTMLQLHDRKIYAIKDRSHIVYFDLIRGTMHDVPGSLNIQQIEVSGTWRCFEFRVLPSGKILQRNHNYNSSNILYLIDGENFIPLVEDFNLSNFDVTPNGSKVCYLISNDGVYLMDANGSNKIKVCEASSTQHIQISPNGNYILFGKQYLLNLSANELLDLGIQNWYDFTYDSQRIIGDYTYGMTLSVDGDEFVEYNDISFAMLNGGAGGNGLSISGNRVIGHQFYEVDLSNPLIPTYVYIINGNILNNYGRSNLQFFDE